MNCKKCNDQPYTVEYVNVGIGNVPVAILWECQDCYEVLENNRDRRMVVFEGWVRSVWYAPSNLMYKIKSKFSKTVIEEDIPF